MLMKRLLALALLAGLAACGERPPTVVFLTDFGVKDDSVALCKGVMWQVEPRLRIVDLTHDVPPFDIETAGRLLEGTAPHFPAGTVFVTVVDPGVGSERKAIAARTKLGHVFVGPDNGVFTRVLEDEGADEVRVLSNPHYFREGKTSSTFHGRDIFSPVGAWIAAGTPLSQLGPVLDHWVTLPHRRAAVKDGVLSGQVEFVELPYGNVITNITAAQLDEAGVKPGDDLKVSLGSRSETLPYRRTFSDVPVGRPLALLSSRGYLSFSLNQGDFSKSRPSSRGLPVVCEKAGPR